MPEPPRDFPQEFKKDGPWLQAWHDPVASLNAHSSCVRLVDLNGDSSNVLLVADKKKLKVYKGTSVVSEQNLLDQPVSLCVFYTDDAVPRTPAIGVAAGPYVFIYRHLRPYFKFRLPPIQIDETDKRIWEELKSGNVEASSGFEMLNQARDSGTTLSTWSLEFLGKEPGRRQEYADSKRGVEHEQLSVVTCMETLQKYEETDYAVSSLVIGTEDCDILILDAPGSKVICSAKLPSVPAIIAVTGLYDVEWRIVCSCRDGKIYTIKNGENKGVAVVTGTLIELETQPNAIARIEKSIFITTMDSKLVCFHIKGRLNFNITLPAPATDMGVVKLQRNRIIEALIVSLQNGEVRLYNGKELIHTLQMNDVITAMRWGQFGRERNSCIFVGRNGSMTLNIMTRQANLEKAGSDSGGPPTAQDVPLKVPKKTKLFVEQTAREKENATLMHRAFQRDLCKLRLTTARNFVKIITSGEAGVSTGGGGGSATSVRMNATVMGLGPTFKFKIEICNGGRTSLMQLPLCLVFNPNIYTSDDPSVVVPLLLPNVNLVVEVTLKNISDTGAADDVRVVLLNPNSTVPLVSALVTMPLSELDE